MNYAINSMSKSEIAKQKIHKEIDSLSDKYIKNVFDFVISLKEKSSNIAEATLMSESALSKDWLSGEENEAWKNL